MDMTIAHKITFSMVPLIPYWLPLLATFLFWKKIDHKLFFVTFGILASAGIQHHLAFMELWAIANGANLYDGSGNWSKLALETAVLSVPVILLSSAALFWLAKAANKFNKSKHRDAARSAGV